MRECDLNNWEKDEKYFKIKEKKGKRQREIESQRFPEQRYIENWEWEEKSKR